MAGLAFHNFVSAATGIALAIAFIRGIARREAKTIGNFWVDLTRCSLYVLLPLCSSAPCAGVSRRRPELQGLHQSRAGRTSAGHNRPTPTPEAENQRRVTEQTIAQGPVASQEIIKELGTNGGGFFNVEFVASIREPDAALKFSGDARHLLRLRRASPTRWAE